MSRGPGKITRGITVALAAAPVRDIGPVPVTYRELAAMIFGTDAPTRSQRVSVGRPARRLEAAGEADLWNVPRVAERSRAELWYVEKVDVREAAVTRPLTPVERQAFELAERIDRYDRAVRVLKIGADALTREASDYYMEIVKAGDPRPEDASVRQ
jgi:hypothetical protein